MRPPSRSVVAPSTPMVTPMVTPMLTPMLPPMLTRTLTPLLVALLAALLFASTGAVAAEPEKPWFVGVADKPKGPLSAAAVEKLIASGELDATSLAWQDGMADWVALSEIPRFRALVVTPPPLPKIAKPPPLPPKAPAPPPLPPTAKAKPPPLPPQAPVLATTPPPLPSASAPQRRVLGAGGAPEVPPPLPGLPVARTTSTASLSSASTAVKKPATTLTLVVGSPADIRTRAEVGLRECGLTAGVVGVVSVLRGVATVTTTPKNPCVERVLASTLTDVSGEEPFEIFVK